MELAYVVNIKTLQYLIPFTFSPSYAFLIVQKKGSNCKWLQFNSDHSLSNSRISLPCGASEFSGHSSLLGSELQFVDDGPVCKLQEQNC